MFFIFFYCVFLSEFDVRIDPLLVHGSDKEEEDIEDHACVHQCLKEDLLKKFFEHYKYVKVVKISKELILTLSVFSLKEFEEFKKVIDDGDLTKSITDFSNTLGLETDLGIFPKRDQHSHIRLDVDLVDDKKTMRKAKSHFKASPK